MSDLLRIILFVIAVVFWSYIIINRFSKVIQDSVEKSMSKFYRDHKL